MGSGYVPGQGPHRHRGKGALILMLRCADINVEVCGAGAFMARCVEQVWPNGQWLRAGAGTLQTQARMRWSLC